MKLLAFETATEACSVALWIDGEVRERFEVAPRRHAELSLPWADALLAEAGVARSQLDALAVSRGPGAFTGVRLGISLVQGIALGRETVGAAASVGLPHGREGWHGVGTGFAAGGHALAERLAMHLALVDATALPRASDLARLAAGAADRGELLAPERVEPAYLRNQVALTLAEQQARRGRS